MENKKPDNVVFSEENGYNASLLPYATNVGAPAIRMDDVVSWKNRNISTVNKEFENKFKELKSQYENLMQEFEFNELVYGAKFSFEPVIGEIYHLYTGDDGVNFLSLIAPQEWNKEHVGTFKLNSDKKWIILNDKATNFY
ncbi:DUF2452 domain-containing protein [Flavobacterium sp.]|jgi:hypothetical protein|uniref:DUF2452 domain-containing protein n=1 Tax=Flavobacterium sp. TaxID=239 RepID=UPI003BCE0A52